MDGIINQDGLFEKFFYEQEFNPIALYEIEPDIGDRGSSAIRYIDVNHAYEVVHKSSAGPSARCGPTWSPAGRR